MRYIITDELWAAMEPLVEQAKRHKGGQPPVLSGRMIFEALLYLARTGIPLRDLPAEFGAWDAVYNPFRRWVGSGARARLSEAMTADPQFGEVRRVLVDSTNVRAHRHAAGAPRKERIGAATSSGVRCGTTGKFLLDAEHPHPLSALRLSFPQLHKSGPPGCLESVAGSSKPLPPV